MSKETISVDDISDVLNFHRRDCKNCSEVDHLAGTINYALDKLLSKIIVHLDEE